MTWEECDCDLARRDDERAGS